MDTQRKRRGISSFKRVFESTLFAVFVGVCAALPVYGADAAAAADVAPVSANATAPVSANAALPVSTDAVLPLSADAVVMDVTYGYQNTAKTGRLLPLEVTLENMRPENFEGTFRILTMEPKDNNNGSQEYDAYSYEYPVKIDGNAQMTSSYSVSVGAGVDQLYLILTDTQGKEVGRKRLKLNLNLDTAELFVGVLSDRPDRLLYLNNVGINYSTLRTRTIELTADTIPENELELDQLDVLLINDFDSGVLTKAQTDAIWKWVGEGGTLLFGTGERGEDTLRGFRQELLESPIPQSEEYRVNMGAQYASDNPEDAVLSLICTEASIKGGNEVLESDELTILTAASVGSGTAAVAVYDFGDIEEFCRVHIAYIDSLFSELLGEDKISALSSNMDVGRANRYWSVQSLISSGNISRLPLVGAYVTLAVAYVVLAGPGLYFFLKHRNMRRYYQPAVAGLSILCTGMVFLMSSATRFQGPFFTYASIQDASDEEVAETTYINLRAPYNKTYAVELESSYTVYPVTGNNYYGRPDIPVFTGEEEPAITLNYGESGTRITAKNTGPFNSRFFEMERREKNTEKHGFTGQIQAFDGYISGTITNNFSQPVENAAVLLYNQMLIIGHMEAGETVRLEDYKVIYGATNFSYAVAAQVTGASGYNQGGSRAENTAYARALERTNLLTFFIDNYLSGYHTEARIVAFGGERGESGFLKQNRYETYGNRLLTSRVDVDYEKDGLVYRSAMQKEPNVLSGEYYAANNTIYGNTPVILEYFLGNDLDVEHLNFHLFSDEMAENMKFYYTVPFTGKMYFYNYNSGDYDAVDMQGAEFGREMLTPYLSPGNTLTVKYVYDAPGDYSWNIMLPVLTVTGRSK